MTRPLSPDTRALTASGIIHALTPAASRGADICRAEDKAERTADNLRFALARQMMANNWRIKAALGLEAVWWADEDENLSAVLRYVEMADDELDRPGLTKMRCIQLQAVLDALFDVRQRIEAMEDR